MKSWNVLIAVPCYDRKLYIETATSITNTVVTLLQEKAQVALSSVNGCAFVSHARNAIVGEFLARKEKTHLLFVDSDMEWSPHTIVRLLKANVPVAVAPYVAKNYKNPPPRGYQPRDLDNFHAATVNWNVQFENPAVMTGEQKLTSVNHGFAKIARVGAGLMLLRRDCIETMVRKFADTEYYWDDERDGNAPLKVRYYGLFNTMMNENKKFVGEDFAFCDRWVKDCGGEIWCDVDARIAHHGHHRYVGNLQESLRIRGRSPSNP